MSQSDLSVKPKHENYRNHFSKNPSGEFIVMLLFYNSFICSIILNPGEVVGR